MKTEEKMETANTVVSVEKTVKCPVEKVWRCWTNPEDIMKWNNASDEWHTPNAENDLRVGGSFVYRMEAKDGSFGFDFGGVYDTVEEYKHIVYSLGDGRKVQIDFTTEGDETRVVETFEVESTNSVELQRGGWQAILDNFKKHCEMSS